MFLSCNAFCVFSVALWQAERTDVKANGQKKKKDRGEKRGWWILKWVLAEEVSALLQPHMIELVIW